MYDVCVCVSQSPSSLYMHKRRVTGTSETLTVVTWGGGESSEVWTLDVRSHVCLCPYTAVFES